MEHGNRAWRYAIRPGADDDPARAAFVEQVRKPDSARRLPACADAKRRGGAARRSWKDCARKAGTWASTLRNLRGKVTPRAGRGGISPPARSKPRPQSGAQTSDNLPRGTCRAILSHTKPSPNLRGFTAPSKPDPRIATRGLVCRHAVLAMPPAALPPHPTM
jgi:hypothetical protein